MRELDRQFDRFPLARMLVIMSRLPFLTLASAALILPVLAAPGRWRSG
jgi:hypothetical protein